MCLLNSETIKHLLIIVVFFSVSLNSQTAREDVLGLYTRLPAQIISDSDYNLYLQFDDVYVDCVGAIDFDFNKLEKTYLSAIDWVYDNEENSELIAAKLRMFLLYSKFKKDQGFLDYGYELLNYADQLSDKEYLRVILGVKRKLDDLEAFSEILKLVPFLEKVNPELVDGTHGLRLAENEEMAWVYYKTHNYLLAADHFLKEAEVLKRKQSSQVLVASMINNAGLSYSKLENFEQARVLFDKALLELDKWRKDNNPYYKQIYVDYFREVINGSYAEIDLKNGDYDKAIPAFKRILRASKQPEINDQFKRPQIQLFLAEAYTKKGSPEVAIHYIDSSLNRRTWYLHTETRVALSELRARNLLQLKRTAEANHFYEIAKKIRDSMLQVQAARQNMIAQAKLIGEEKERELIKIKEDIAVKERTTALQFWALLIAIILLGVIVFYYIKSLRNNKTIEGQKSGLEASVREKEVLLKEIHHRVKNNLQVVTGLLQLQTKKADSPAMNEALLDSQRHVNSIALVHEMLYQQEDHAMVPMKGYMEKLAKQILYGLMSKTISHSVDVDGHIELSVNKAIPLGLMISELLSNANKYAFDQKAGNVFLSLKETDNERYCFKYADNGKGLPEDFRNDLKKTLGFRLMYMLAEELDGEIEINGNGGVVVEVYFKRTNGNG